MNDQAEELRRMVEQLKGGPDALASGPRTVAVTSGKGGVGKSNIAVNLCIALAERGTRVALLDADWGLSNTEVLMGITPKRDLRHVLRGECTVEEILLRGPMGMLLIPGASGVAEVANLSHSERDRLIRGLTHIEHLADMVVIDTSPGISDSVIDLAAGADHIFVVTTPEPTSMTDAYAYSKVLHQRHREAPVSLLVNMADDRSHAECIYSGFSSVTERFLGRKVPMGGYVVRDPKVPLAVRRQSPLLVSYPNAPSADCFRQLAGSLLDTSRGESPVMGEDVSAPLRPVSQLREKGRSLLQRLGLQA